MALPRWERETVRYTLPGAPPRRVASPGPGRSPRRSPGRSRKEVLRRRRMLLLVVVPVLMMLGSVYLHTVAAGLGERVAALEERVERAELEKERLDLKATELSAPGRIQSLAEEDLDMASPGGGELEVYGKDGEDEKQNLGAEASKGAR
ncbi:MAG: cell division protein FtsL [Rubrobacter sp.]|nr:cell division protein FtsL [Rubrobacter sp.]MDQ3317319.1 cell division protein FtsL [Actinomycetota bacterium]